MAGAALVLSDWQRVSDRAAGLALLGVGGAAILLSAFVAVDDSCVGVGYGCPTGFSSLAAVVAIIGLGAAALGTGLLLVEERQRRTPAGPLSAPGRDYAGAGTVVDRYCPRCGAGSPQSAAFCHRCGGPLPTAFGADRS